MPGVIQPQRPQGYIGSLLSAFQAANTAKDFKNKFVDPSGQNAIDRRINAQSPDATPQVPETPGAGDE